MTYSISVVIPNYNRQQELLRAIDSVRAQTYSPAEILVIDDASDFSVEDYLDAHHYLDGSVRVIRNPENRGLSASRNEAFRQASGQLIALLDSDDWWHADKLKEQVRLFEEDPNLDLVATRDWIVKEDQTKERNPPFYRDQLFDRLTTDWAPPVPSTVVAKREVYANTPYQEQVRYQVDTDWWLRFALTEPNIARVDRPLAYYYAGENDRLSGAYYVERFRKIETFIALWRDKITTLRGEARFRAFRKNILSYNAIDAFVEQYNKKNVPVAFRLYTKYLWNQKSFYRLLANKLLP